MSEVYVGNLDPNTPTRFIEQELQIYGEIISVKIPRSSSASSSLRRYAFVEFKHRRDAQFAIHSWNSKFNWRLELSRNSIAVTNTVNADSSCYSCGGYGHFSRNCPHFPKDIKSKGVKQSLSERKNENQVVKQFPSGRKNENQVASTLTWQPVAPPWVELPENITAKILHKLGPVELLVSAQKVCRSWRKICRDPAMWRVIDMWKLGVYRSKLPYDCKEALCRLAVDLSQGQVTEIKIEDFGNYDLLEYILERCGRLRCLRFAFCDDLSFTSLSESKAFPLLEELHIDFNPVEKDDIEAIGRSFPMLKTFSLNYPACERDIWEKSIEVLPVATFMPELRHLQLIANEISNDVLEAILNGCPKLEFLDLRKCFNLHLEGELGKRCAQQIKILRCPRDSTEDYVWETDWALEEIPKPDSYPDYEDSDSDVEYDDFCDPFQFGGDLDYDIKSKGVKQSQGGRKNKNQVAPTVQWQPVPPPWVELPEDITAKILHKLGPVDLLVSAQKVCRSWRKICRDPAMWRVIELWKLGVYRSKLPYDCKEALCRLAVDLSQGQVTEIKIEDFGNYDLLEYILERCGHLRCLHFAFCEDLSFKSLSESKGFPQLEELHIDFNPIEKDDIEAIGRSFPMLKTFCLNYPACERDIWEKSIEVEPVATFMPELRHLQLIANEMSNDVLEAILNGCPKLESLDLRKCSNLHLEGELGKRCAQQIKILRRPRDSTEDYVWETDWALEEFPKPDSYPDDDDSESDVEDDFCDPLQFGGDLDYDDVFDPFQFQFWQ